MKISDLSTEPLWVDLPAAFKGLMWRRNPQDLTHSANVLVNFKGDPDSPRVLRITDCGAPGMHYGKATFQISAHALCPGTGMPPGPHAPLPEAAKSKALEYWLNQQQADSLRLSAQQVWQSPGHSAPA